jgi:hypothetical protein
VSAFDMFRAVERLVFPAETEEKAAVRQQVGSAC